MADATINARFLPCPMVYSRTDLKQSPRRTCRWISPSPATLKLSLTAWRKFVDDEVVPLETELLRTSTVLTGEMVRDLRVKAKAAKLWAPTMPKAWGGMGLNIQEIVPVFEAAGRSLLGSLAIHCAAPRRRQYAPAAQLGERRTD